MALGALIPWWIGRTIDSLRHSGTSAGDLAFECLVLVALIVGGAVLGTLQERCDTTTRLETSLRTMVLVNAQAVRLSGQGRHRAGNVVNLGMGDIAPIGTGVAALSRGIGGVTAVLVVAVILVTFAWQLCLLVIVGAIILLNMNDRLLAPYRSAQRIVRERMGDLTAVALDATSGLRVIKSLGASKQFVTSYQSVSRDVQAAGNAMAKAEGVAAGGKALYSGVLNIVTVFVAAELTLNGSITIGALVATYGYVVFMATPVRWMLTTNQRWSAGKVCAERVGEYLAEDPAVIDPETSEDDADATGPVRLIQAARGYTVLTSIDRVDWSDIVSRMRASHPDPRELLLVSSDDYLFSGPLGVVIDPFKRASESEVNSALRTSSFDRVVRALEQGMAHEVTAGASDFSGGEQQRMRLTRALLADPASLVLVEPTNAIDSTTEVEVVQQLRRHRAGRTTVVLTNNPLHFVAADRVVLLRRGRLVADGSHEQLLDRPDYRAMVERHEADA